MLEKTIAIIGFAGTFLAFPGLLLYCIFEAQKKEKPRLLHQIGALLALGVYALGFCWISAQVRSIAPFQLINKERSFFWGLFMKELEKKDSFVAAAEAMDPHLPEVAEFIQSIAADILCCGVILSFAALVLLGTVVVMMIRSRRKKVAPWLLTLTVAAACALGTWGGHLCFFSSVVKYKLNWYSELQHKILEECVKENKGTFRTNKEIASLLPRYLKETPYAFGENWGRLKETFYIKTVEKKKK